MIRRPATFLAPILISCLFPVYLAPLSTYAISSCSLLYSSFRASTYRCNPPTRVPYDITSRSVPGRCSCLRLPFLFSLLYLSAFTVSRCTAPVILYRTICTWTHTVLVSLSHTHNRYSCSPSVPNSPSHHDPSEY
ncbi:hypothetical protein C8Q76DRAFT_50136 [Earliella scabrosa]|nr:hypothetical protein C8Q76DRAFT_50136 [Earliella scabrosa]